jgi:two-component system, LytTR family, response regulator
MSQPVLRIIVVDDEPHARADIVALLESRPDCRVVATAGSGVEAVDAASKLTPDVMLLDIRMPGVDGFGVIEKLDAANAPYVIFVTAFDRYAIEAFRVRALDYLLKPVHPARLDDALARAREQIGLRSGAAVPAYRKEILVRVGMRDVVVRVEDIDWIEADTYCVNLHAGSRTHVLRERMHVLEGQLDPSIFRRVHRSAIVNLDRVREIEHDGRGDHVIVLTTGARVRTSHSRWLEFRDTLQQRNRPDRAASRPIHS